MAAIVIKIVNKNEPTLVAEAEGQLQGAGFVLTFRGEADVLGVDAQKHGGGEQTYHSAVILVGER